MAKAKATKVTTKETTNSRQTFTVLTPEQIAELSQEEQKRYNAKLNRRKKQAEKKDALEKAETLVVPRMELLEHALKTGIAKNAGISCGEIDVTFASPCARAMYVTKNMLVKFINKGDLIQLNCHTMPRLSTPCVVVKNDVFYFAQLTDEAECKYQNMDTQCAAESEFFVASYDEFIGDIVNIIKNPKALFEDEEPSPKETEEE